ncbi:30423_t:CDS:2 [Racocetra persica]|uniref:30423_t:CDS:1 n=1 Tax=Racocetra persica TaxID=160502 RepID=A0ACA9MQW8_9GLOM|nr:30423_t:CDS:2 [Racocetra persica]
MKNTNSNDKPDRAICLFQNLYTVLENMHGNTYQHSGSKKTFDVKEIYIINGRSRHPQSQGMIENSNKTLKNVLSAWMEDNDRRDWSIGLLIVTYLPESVIEDKEVSENDNNNLSDDNGDFNKIVQINNTGRSSASQSSIDSQIVNSQIYIDLEGNYTMQSQTTFNDQQMQSTADDTSKQIISVQDDFTKALNNLTSQHNIYRQVANKNLEDYHSKMKNQMLTKYKINERVYEVVFAVLLRNIYRLVCHFGIFDQTFLAGVVLPLGPKEFLKLDNPPTTMTVSMIEAARL